MKNPILNAVLLVDDDDSTNFIHKTYLQKLNLADKVMVTTSGRQAIRFLSSQANNRNNPKLPDLILLDLNMPDMNGYEFLDQFRKLNIRGKSCKIVIVSSFEAHFEKHKSANHPDVLDYITKPIRQQDWKNLAMRIYQLANSY